MVRDLSLVILLLSFLLCSCNSNIPYTKIEGRTQGTTFHITYQSKKLKNYGTEIEALLDTIDKTASIYNPKSLISKINQNDTTVTLNKHLLFLLKKSEEMFYASNGMFDVTVGALVNAYGFGNSNRLTMTAERIDSFLEFTGFSKILITGNRLLKKDNRVQIDLNAIAQGYTVDVIADFFNSEGIENYLIEVGGEVRAKGKNPNGEIWKVGIDKPAENNDAESNLQVIIRLSDKSLATSGNYRKFYFENGVKYVHTVNPVTGKTVKSNLLSVSVIAPDCTTADAAATACMAMGLEESKKLLSKLRLDAYLVYADAGNNLVVYTTPGISTAIQYPDSLAF